MTEKTVVEDIFPLSGEGERIGCISWTDCHDESEAQHIMNMGSAGPAYTQLIEMYAKPVFPFRLLNSIDIFPLHQRQGYGSLRILKFIVTTRTEGFKRIYLRIGYENKKDREWLGKFYERFDFVGFRSKREVGDLMLLNL